MRRTTIRCLAALAGLMLLAPAGRVRAYVPRSAPSVPQRVALADCVFIGKVTALEAGVVNALPTPTFPGARKVPYQVAVVEVGEALAGPKEPRRVRVGFLAPPPEGKGPRFRRLPPVKLTAGQEACFFLVKHPEESFYVAPAEYDLLDKKSEDFAGGVALARRCARLLNDREAGLASKEAEDRFLTAALLIYRYRTPRGTPQTEPVDAGQSRRILEVLAEADWGKTEAGVGPRELYPLSGRPSYSARAASKSARVWGSTST